MKHPREWLSISAEASPVRVFLRDSALSYGAQVLVLGLGFITSVLVARALGPEGRGVFAWMMNLHMVAVGLATLGMDTVVRKIGADQPKRQGELLGTAPLVLGAVGLLLAPALFWLGSRTAIGLLHPRQMLFALLMVPVVCAMNVGLLLLVSQHRLRLYNMVAILPKLLAFAGMVLLLATGAVSVQAVLVASLLGAVPAVAWALRLHLKAGVRPRLDFALFTKGRRFWGGAYIATLATYLLLKQDLLLLARYAPEAEVGHYSVAATLIDVLQLAPALMGMFLLNHLVRIKDRAQRRAFFAKVMAALGALFVAGAAAGAVLAPWLVGGLFGEAYLPAVPLLRILLGAFVFLGLFTMLQNATAIKGQGLPLMAPALAGWAVNLGLNLWWLPLYGATGAAWASLLGYAAACAAAGWAFARVRPLD